MVLGRIKTRDDRKEAHEVAIGSSDGQDGAIASPVHSGDLAAALHDLNLVGMDLRPVAQAEESDGASGSYGEFLQFLVDTDALNRVVADLRLEKLLARFSRLS